MPVALLVEDNRMNRKLLRDIFSLRFEVLESADAEQAAELLQEHHPDVIILDLQLPGMSGLEFLRLLKGAPETADIPVVVISAHAMPDDIRQARASGCVECVTKPIVEDPFLFADRMTRLVAAGARKDHD
ncbi:MAG: response regulator [Gemmataceae bacterium]